MSEIERLKSALREGIANDERKLNEARELTGDRTLHRAWIDAQNAAGFGIQECAYILAALDAERAAGRADGLRIAAAFAHEREATYREYCEDGGIADEARYIAESIEDMEVPVDDLDVLETAARAAVEADARLAAAVSVYERYDAAEAGRGAWDDLGAYGVETLALIAEVRAAREASAAATDLITRLRAVVAADDAIQHAYREIAEGRAICPRVVWRGLYADRERAARELWGTCADDRAACARRLLEVLDVR